MITWRPYYSVLLYSGNIVFLMRRHTEIADPLGIDWVHEKLLLLFCFVRSQRHADFVGTPFRELISLWHCEREILIIILNKFMIYDVYEVKILDVLLIKVFGVKVVIAEYYTIGFILKYYIKGIMQLIFPVLTKLWRL